MIRGRRGFIMSGEVVKWWKARTGYDLGVGFEGWNNMVETAREFGVRTRWKYGRWTLLQ